MFEIRISAASPEADLEACVLPGLRAIWCPSAQIQRVDELISKFERLRGIRPGAIEIKPLVETPYAVTQVHHITMTPRVNTLATRLTLDGDALAYARSECELAARALDLTSVELTEVRD